MTHKNLTIIFSVIFVIAALAGTIQYSYADHVTEECESTPILTAIPSETSVTLNWNEPHVCDEDGSIPPYQYIITNNDNDVTFTTTDLYFTIDDLEYNTEYTFRVVAIYADYNNQGRDITFTTLVNNAPPDDEENNTGGSCSGDCTPPTFGVLPTGEQFVDVGFEFDDLEFIIDKYHVEVPLINANVGEEYIIKTKVFEANGPVAHYGITFGVGDVPVPIYSQGSSFIDLDRLIFKEYSDVPLYEVTILDDDNLINLVRYATGTEVCNDTTTQLCQTFELVVSFNQRLVEEKLMIQAWDDSRNLAQNLLNDGLDVTGISLNDLPTFTVSDKYERNTIKVITLTDDTLEDLSTAADSDGIQWYLVNNFWQRDAPPQVIQDTDPNSRNSLAFKEKMLYEQIKAYYINLKLGY